MLVKPRYNKMRPCEGGKWLMDVITDYGTFLREAKTAVLELRDMQQQEQQLLKRLKQDQKQLETDKKAVEDRISQTTKKRLGEITASYDKELGKGQDQLKKVRSKREKAKNQGVKERIIDETSDLRDDNRRIRLQIKTIFQQNHVPGICDTNLYYTLYFPRHFGEILKLFAAIVLVFLLLPYGIYWVLKKPNVIYLVGIYFVFILVFGGAYVLWGNKTRDRYGKVLKEGRLLRDEIHANARKIKTITRNIRRDRNETIYDLQKYDDEIAQIEQELSQTVSKKKEALNAFETVTKNIIADEIHAGTQEKIAQQAVKCRDEERELLELQGALKKKNLFITDHYGPYLSREFLEPDKLDALAGIMTNGTAANLSEAMPEYKKMNNA